ncbi:Uncharacterized protein APZ42_025118 [Daphnia magna]|uniref:Uncharacterized protein n=1 Tax=Daphnia magna TaxID=35525 RepID=A0A164TG45_9CRUS|nr:Uncharacterized protein APZ42_025118 [Daphnia magna]
MSFKDLIKSRPTVRLSLLVSIDLNRLGQIPSRDELNELEAKTKRVQQTILAVPKQKQSKENTLVKTKAPVRFQAPAMRSVVAARAKIDSLHRSLFGGKLPPPAPAPIPKKLTHKPNPSTDRLVRPQVSVLTKPEPGLMRPLPSRECPNYLMAKRKREEDAPATLPVEKRFKDLNSKDYKVPVRFQAPPMRSEAQITAEVGNLHRSLFQGLLPSKNLTNKPQPMSDRPVRPPLPVAEPEQDLPLWCRQSFYDYNYQFSFD